MPTDSRHAPVDPWAVEAADFPSQRSVAEKLAFLANYAVLAPSLLNLQPWRFRISGDTMTLRAHGGLRLPVTDPAGRELTISCGAALLNLRIAAAAAGCEAKVDVLSDEADPACLAAMTMTGMKPPSAPDVRLRDAIPARRTNRGDFEDRALEKQLLDELASAARQEAANITFLHGTDQKARAAELIAEAERTQLADERFSRELAEAIGQRISEAAEPVTEADRRLSGHLPSLSHQHDLFTPMAASVMRTFADGDAVAARQRARAEGSPVLALLWTDKDTPVQWIAAGQALQRALLVATLAGASASYFSAPVEVDAVRARLADACGIQGFPQALLRLGYGPMVSPAARRPLQEVLQHVPPLE